MQAAARGHAEVVRFLVEAGASLDPASAHGETAHWLAAKHLGDEMYPKWGSYTLYYYNSY